MHQIMDEEKKLLERFGRENPFRTPENYFDTLPEAIMRRIDSGHKTRQTVWRGVAAAIIAGFVATAGFMVIREHDMANTALEADGSSQYIEDVLDYSMIDNNEIAFYLTQTE